MSLRTSQYFKAGGRRWLENARQRNRSRIGCLVGLALLLAILAGCTGLNDRQLMADQTIYESSVVVERANTQKAEFDQLVVEYQDTREGCYLQRMHALIALMRKNAGLAAAFFHRQKYYPKGISFQRWQVTRHAYELTRMDLCEMMLATADMEMLSGDKEKAKALLDAFLTSFPGEEYAGYRREAQNREAELGRDPVGKDARAAAGTGRAR